MTDCPYCGKLTDPKLPSCPHCGGFLQQSGSTEASSRARGRQTCPSCRAMVQEGDIICMVCGTNLLTGQKVSQGTQGQKTVAGRGANWTLVTMLFLAFVVVCGVVVVTVAMRNPVDQAQRLMSQGKYSEALKKLKLHVNLESTDAGSLYDLARLHVWDRNYGVAAQFFERAYTLDEYNSEAALWAVVCLEQERAQKNRNKQIALLERLTRSDPASTPAWYLLAFARGLRGDTAGQVDALEKLITQGNSQAAIQWGVGVGNALEKNFRLAERGLRQSEDNYPPAELAVTRGFVFALQGANKEAITELASAVREETLSVRWEALVMLGRLLFDAGRFGEAEGYLSTALSLRRQNAEVRLLRAFCLEAMGNRTDALAEFESLAKDQGPHAAEAAVHMAHMHLRSGNVDRARQAIGRATTLGADNAQYYTVRGRVDGARGEYGAAFNALKQATTQDPSYAPTYLESGLLNLRQEALSESLRNLERYLELVGSKDGGSQYHEIRVLADQLRKARGSGTPDERVRSAFRRPSSGPGGHPRD